MPKWPARMKRVAVTGIGLCAPATWQQVLAGECGLAPEVNWIVAGSGLRTGRVAEDAASLVRGLPPGPGGPWRPDRMDPVSHFALLAAARARTDAGLDGEPLDQAAVVIASAMGGEQTHDQSSRHLEQHLLTGRRLRFSPFIAPRLMPNAASANVGMLLGAHGPNVSPAAACASGAYSIAQAADLIRAGKATTVFCGASEAPCEEIAALVFSAGDALSEDGRSLPFSRDRNGFCLAEGAAVLVLEEFSQARSRGIRIYGELAGSGLTCDAYHVVAPHPDGTYAGAAMRAALDDAGLQPADVGYVNAHATGTVIGDAVECRAIRSVWSGSSPCVSSTKGSSGHLLGASGAFEAAMTLMALNSGLAPPTAGLTAQGLDEECAQGLRLVYGAPAPIEKPAAVSNSFAFGGHNACLVFVKKE